MASNKDYNIINSPSHYVSQGGIEPIEFIKSRGFDFCEGNVIKYICRYKDKGGVDDLNKAREYIDHLIQGYKTETASYSTTKADEEEEDYSVYVGGTD